MASLLSSITGRKTASSPQKSPSKASSRPPLVARALSRRTTSGLSETQEQDRVVLDIGCRYIRAGFSGEATPLASVRMATKGMKRHWEGGRKTCNPVCMLEGEVGTLWGLDVRDCDTGVLDDTLELYLRQIYQRYLLVDSKTKKVILTESPLTPIHIKMAMARILFTYFQIPSITFISSPTAACVASGVRNGFVIDIGWQQTIITPVYDLRPLTPFIVRTGIAGNRLHRRVEYLLRNYGFPPLPPNSRAEDTEDFCQRGLICLPTTRIPSPKTTADEDFRSTYDSDTRTSDVEWTAPTTGERHMIPGWIRDAAVEIFFEGAEDEYQDNDARSLPQAVTHSLRKCSRDIRAQVTRNVILTGGCSNIPGIRTRIRSIVQSSLSKITGSADAGERVRVLETPNEAAWVGASLLGSMRVQGLFEITRGEWYEGVGVPDWTQFREIVGVEAEAKG
ncbi:actin-like ATPase domain-containing protein [Saitoella complicata NRRL Y-17804]|uniref:Uncharacterized protein n=1 Tax=Saitoella complicata (strain BCRC 22490 / CBS 7301 / JCM 7358 / NBRC 10748 / NRRL Y-17804) TaxID=698492 RepID=A0A0E9NLN0_SAICN|nr:actin-like ATPase domain-containing protein [Saitoella complicata NRRL Y-17804]ODQ54805.1 actin-like ATPase domain-containing protein [Saitoella complicata NRRL Y-17804]GAO50586.1 hypothetical protein G7K_4710-t1 [Saitoella complicata NRRL Y-17804]